MINELFERELRNTSINDVSLADYIKENYLPVSVFDKIRAEIEQMDFDFGDFYDHTETIREMVLEVIDKYNAEKEQMNDKRRNHSKP